MDKHLWVPFILNTVETEVEATIKDAESQISKAIEFAIQFMVADIDKNDEEEIK